MAMLREIFMIFGRDNNFKTLDEHSSGIIPTREFSNRKVGHSRARMIIVDIYPTVLSSKAARKDV